MTPRRSGILVPLFSIASSRSWGIGEFHDLPTFARWLESAGQGFVQILPITELPEGESSPYSAMTAMAIDPIFITPSAVADFEALGGESALPAEERATLDTLRRATRVDYVAVRRLKETVLRRAHQRFVSEEIVHQTDRGRAYATFVEEESRWLDDYALFLALHKRFDRRPWWDWPREFASRDPKALGGAAQRERDEIAFRKYLQWLASEQWDRARRDAAPVQIFGDVPFMISADSPDVWTRQDEFRFDATVGVPPDAFSKTGQDWGLPPWRWDVMRANDFSWMRTRAERTARLFDGFRLDHLVGLYRTYMRPKDKARKPFFAPPDQESQLALGETLVALYSDTGAEVIAEDLGTVPAFVRESLDRLEVPGFKVLRWEREWEEPGEPFIDPTEYKETSVATTGTHDTEPLVTWWETAPEDERAAVRAMPTVKKHLTDSVSERDALLRALLESRSRLTIIPLQDVFGWTDRINTPAEVSGNNWTWLLRWRVDQLLEDPEARARAQTLARWTAAAGR